MRRIWDSRARLVSAWYAPPSAFNIPPSLPPSPPPPPMLTSCASEYLLRNPLRLHARSPALGSQGHGQRHLDRSEQDHGDCERGRCYGREYGDAGADLHLCCAVYCYGECGGGVSFRTYGKEIFVILLLDFWMQDVRREERAGC